jgi:hypothetical protein
MQVRIVDRLQEALGLLEVGDRRAVLVHALVRGARVEQRLGFGVHVAQLHGQRPRLERRAQGLDGRADHAVATGDEEQQPQPLASGVRRQQAERLVQRGLCVAAVERAVEGCEVHGAIISPWPQRRQSALRRPAARATCGGGSWFVRSSMASWAAAYRPTGSARQSPAGPA